MNILFLINYAGNSGSEKYVDNLQRIFSKKGCTCFFAYNVEGKLSDTMKERGVECLKLPLTSSDIKSSSKILAGFCRDKAIDVIHAQFPVENVIAIKSLKYYSLPGVVFTSHLSDRQGLKWNIINRIYTPKNHCVICVCDEGKKNLIASGINPAKIKVIYNGIAANENDRQNVCGEVFKLVTVSRYAPEKGLDFLLDVLARLKEKTDKRFVCTIVGEGNLFDDIAQKANLLGLSDCLVQTGYRNDTQDILFDSNLYLNTSRSGEALSFAILEAMNASLPLVVTDVGGNKMLAEKDIVCGKTLSFGDIEGYSDAVLEYMNNPDLLLQDGNNSKRKAREMFNLEKLAEDVFAAYK